MEGKNIRKMVVAKKHYTTSFENLTNIFSPEYGFPLAISNHRKPLIVGIGGGLASGKTTFCDGVLQHLGAKNVISLSMKLFCKNLTPEDQEAGNEYNFYCPDAYDFDLIYETVSRLKNGKSVTLPNNNLQLRKRKNPNHFRSGAEIVILEGMFIFCNERVRDLMDYKFFIDTDPDVSLLRYVDVPTSHIKETYLNKIKPAFELYVKPSSKYADLEIKCNDEKSKAFVIIANAIKMELIKDEFFPKRFGFSTILEIYNDPLSPSFNLVKEAPEIGAVQTLSAENERNKTTYYLEHLMRKLYHYVVNQVCYEDFEIKLSDDEIYQGKRIKYGIHGMILIRTQTDQSLIDTFRFSLKFNPVGTVVINTNSPSSKPHICFHGLPKNAINKKLFLLDATVSSGSCLLAVINRLCEEIPGKRDGYKQENIIVCTAAMTKFGIKRISKEFPRVQFYTPFLDCKIVQEIYNFDDNFFDVNDYNICHEE
uniref:Phosphoribulokinase/uridine kinase domain-containing protein n=1 Tax=Panagrolaimus sp. PS1159 TaxID=55785 RepID=A0AC35GHX6_9BILA